jgi:hypothetical protein
MNIESKKLVEFLSKIKGAEVGPNEIKMNFGPTLTVSAINTEQSVIVEAQMQPTEFTGYESLGTLAVDDLKTLITILGGFTKVSIEKNDNLLTLKEGGKTVQTILTNPEFIKEAPKKELQHEEILSVNAKTINDFISRAKLNKELTLKLKTLPKQLVLETDGKYKFTEILEAPEAVGGVEVKVKSPFIGTISEFGGPITLKLRSNYPIQVMEKLTSSTVSVVSAPLIDTPKTEE